MEMRKQDMGNQFSKKTRKKAGSIQAQRIFRSRWFKSLVAMGSAVVFFTVYSLIIPAATLAEDQAAADSGIVLEEPAPSEPQVVETEEAPAPEPVAQAAVEETPAAASEETATQTPAEETGTAPSTEQGTSESAAAGSGSEETKETGTKDDAPADTADLNQTASAVNTTETASDGIETEEADAALTEEETAEDATTESSEESVEETTEEEEEIGTVSELKAASGNLEALVRFADGAGIPENASLVIYGAGADTGKVQDALWSGSMDSIEQSSITTDLSEYVSFAVKDADGNDITPDSDCSIEISFGSEANLSDPGENRIRKYGSLVVSSDGNVSVTGTDLSTGNGHTYATFTGTLSGNTFGFAVTTADRKVNYLESLSGKTSDGAVEAALSFGKDAKVPEGSSLTVETASVNESSVLDKFWGDEEGVNRDTAKADDIRFVKFAIRDRNGNEVRPETRVSVKLTFHHEADLSEAAEGFVKKHNALAEGPDGTIALGGGALSAGNGITTVSFADVSAKSAFGYAVTTAEKKIVYATKLTGKSEDGSIEASLRLTEEAKIPEGSLLKVTPVTGESVRKTLLDNIWTDTSIIDPDTIKLTDSGLATVTITDKDGKVRKPEADAVLTLTFNKKADLAEAARKMVKRAKAVEMTEENVKLSDSGLSVAEGKTRISYTGIVDGQTFGYAVSTAKQKTNFLEGKLSYEGEDYTIEVNVSKDNQIPENSKLNVKELDKDSEEFKKKLDQATEAIQKDAEKKSSDDIETSVDDASVRMFDITILNEDGDEIQPNGNVRVSVQYKNAVKVGADAKMKAVHFDEKNDEVQVLTPETKADTSDTEKKVHEVKFDANGFSVYAVVSTTVSQTLTASDGNEYLVTVTYDNTSSIPEDAELVVSELKEGDEGYDEYVAAAAEKLGESLDNLAFARPFDITLKNPETGEEYQPTKDVTVTIQLLNDDLNEYANIDVIHFPGEADGEAEIMDSSINGESIEFETDGFSVYVLTGTDAVPRRTYNFFIWTDDAWAPYMFTSDSGEETSSQTVRDGQKPTVPSPEKDTDGKPFAGWYAYKENSTTEFEDEPYNFDAPVTQDEVVSLYAVFSDYLNVIFHDQFNDEIHDFPIAGTRRGELNAENKATIQIDDMSTTYSGGSDMAFYGWSRTPITVPGAAKDDNGENVTPIVPDENGCIEITSETHLYPIYRSVKWLSFWSGPTGSGATYYPADSYFDGVGPATLADHVPTRSGYTFLGWYAGTIDPATGEVTYGANPITNADGTLINNASDAGMSVYGDALHLTTDSTLYAKWSGEDSANYKIIIWKQKTTSSTDTPDKFKYDFYSSIVKSAPIGGTATIDDEYKSYADSESQYYNAAFSGYACRSDADVTVNEKGYTVLNVYYDRIGDYTQSGSPHTLTFKNSSDNSEIVKYDTVAYETDLLTGNEGGSFVPADQTRANYTFTGWFADSICSTQVFFSQADLDKYTGYNKTVLYDKMPDEDLTIYAGWEADWYIVQVDPNYGSFNGTGSTWFWKTIESDLVQEYTQVTRDYVESSSGQYYYVKHDRAYYGYSGNEWDNSEPDRNAYYTLLPGEATEYKRFEEVPGIYSYAGWYEVLADGSEIPYDFNQHVDHDTYIRLHWKKAGDFYLRYYDGKGTDSTTDDVITNDTDCYADNAQILITKGATAPEGYTFAGWRVQGDTDGPVYGVGKTFILNSDDAVSISGKETVTLEAIYVKLGTAKIVYNFNGGTADETFDYGHPEDTSAQVSYDPTTHTVSNIVNNSGFYLSNGTGLTLSGATLKGWSDLQVYDPDATDAAEHFFALGFDPNNDDEITAKMGLYGVDTEDPIILYAVWEFTVSWHLNIPDGKTAADFSWGGDWTGYETETVNSEEVKTKTVYQGNVVTEPADVPKYNGTENLMFTFWGIATDSTTAYNYSQPVTCALDLYACWSEAKTVTAHAVDASAQTLAEKTNSDEGWTVNNITVGQNVIELTESSHVTAPSSYLFAFAAVSQNLESVSPTNEITHIKYDSSSQKVKVKYKGESAYRVLGDGREIYFVYYQEKSLNIGYKEMQPSGVLDSVTGMSGSACISSGTITDVYEMATGVNAPLAWGNNGGAHVYTNYAFAIGKADPNDVTQMNASDLSLITAASNSDDSLPVLRVRNTWRGFEYTTESGDNAVWTNCGYNPQLYVIYYTQQPTVIMFSEQTVGLSAVMGTEFTFNLKVTETTTSAQKQQLIGFDWENVGSPEDYTSDIFDTTVLPNTPYVLKNGEANSAILFYSIPGEGAVLAEETTGTDTYRYIATADSATSQTAVITQTVNDGFTTSINGTVQNAEPYRYTYTSDGTGGTQNVVFTNKHKAAEVEVHIARIENGSIVLRDELRSTTDEATYKFSQLIDGNSNFLTVLPADTVYADATGVYTLGSVVLGTDSGNVVSVEAMDVANISYGQVEGNSYALLLKNGEGSSLGDLGNKKIYYLYYPMPKIQYIKQEGETLSRIMGSTDGINQSTSITYGGAELEMNGVTVVQDQRIALPLSGLRISQESGAANFSMPPILDDGTFQNYLTYTKIGVGSGITSGGTQDISELGDNVSDKLEMLLQIKDNALQWSFDGTTWHSMGEEQAIYAIYSESGYDLQLSKIVDTSVSGSNPIYTDRQFTVTIEPAAGNSFNTEQYDIEGYSSRKISVENGKITLTVEDGTKVKILGLRRGGYVITESNNANYDLSAKSGPIIGSATTVETVTNSSVNLTLDNEKQLVLTNSPKALCEVVRETETDGVPFYTLSDAIKYIVDNYADGTATIAMLSDYLMPDADALTIPSSAHITLTTATRGTQKYPGTGRAVISRSAGLTSAPMITSSGELTLINITLDGQSVESTAPMLQCNGTLTLDRGTTLQNAMNSGNGGAISATGTVAIIGTEDVYLRNNQAANGGLLYYSGTGTVTVSGGSVTGNTAAQNGGAIYAVGGTITLSGGTFSGNTATGNGGAVYGENAVIELSGSTVTANAASVSGGAVYSSAGAVTVSGGSITGNTATQNGGAVYAGSGKVTVSGGSVNLNTSTNGSGGAIYTNTGAVEISGIGTTVNGNAAANGNGGAVYSNTGNVTISGGTVGASGSANRAKNGGAVYANGGAVTVSDGSVTGNTATENGGAIYAGSGTVSVSGGSMAGNSATGTGETTGFGGAVYIDTGSAVVSGGVIGVSGASGTANSAKNGAAIYISNGTGSFSGGTISGNTATAGGAVGVGTETVRLDFSGTINITGNTMGGAACNVYLDQDTEGVINTGGFGTDAYVGVYVPDMITVPGDNPGETKTVDIFKKRGDVGAEFGIYSGTGTTVPQFHNDREANLTAAVDSITKKIYWSSPLKLEIRYLSSFASNLPNGTNGDSKLNSTTIYPSSGNVSLSVLADEKRSSCSNLSATAVYATALYELEPSYDSYLTKLLWDEGKWKLEKRSGDVIDLNTSKKIIIYFAEPAYLSIENNTDFNFNITSLTVNLAGQDRSLLNNNTTTGLGLVYAKDGVIQEQLLPVQADERGVYTLSKNGGSVIILIPGGRSRSFSLNGTFVNGTGTVQVRQTGQTASSINADENVERTGTTPSDSSIYEIIFGPDKAICKIVCAEPSGIDSEDFVARSSVAVDGKYEYTFSKMQNAVTFAQKYKLTDVDIEMLVDYLMPSTDTAVIADPDGHHFESITLTTAKTGEFRYSGASSDGRATISRGLGNEQPLVEVAGNVGTSGNDTETHVYVSGINFDGKNLTGACEGGALATKDCCVSITNAKFVNCVSRNGGAVFISFGTPNTVNKGETKKYSFASDYNSKNATLTLTNVQISNCTATYYYGRSGGGAIWTNAKTLTAEYCDFTNCISDGKDMQGGAVFHRIEATNKSNLGPTPYYNVSQTLLSNCTFTGCKAEAGGGMESDATDIQLTDCTFTNCSSTKKDGGAINVYIYETDYNYTSIPSSIHLTGCSFISCTSNRNGGAVRSLAVDTTVTNCTFTNTVAKNDNSGNGGGAIYVSNQDSNTTTITGCTFTGAVSNKGMGGAVYTLSKALTVTNTTMTNCQANGSSNGNGGAIYHYPNYRSNLANSYISLNDCTITGCTAKKGGGAVYSYAQNGNADKKTLVGCTIEGCTAQAEGGGVYLANPNVTYVKIEDTTIKDCSSASSGGGLYSKALYLTISGKVTSHALISGCTSGANGGGIYHYRQNAEINVSYTTINGCTAAESGGGFYTSYAKTADFTNCVISNNTVTGTSGTAATKGCGGGILFDTSATFTLTDTTVSGNKASNLGGGIYTKKYLTLVCSIIEDNELTTNTVANAAGVYMTDDGVLVVGASGSEIDNSAVMNNTTANGADSNLRMPVYTSGTQNGENKNCVTVNCPLGSIAGEGGYIGVTNAWKVGTQFGVSNITGDPTGLKDPDGVVVKDTVFNADTSTLYGIISRTDITRKQIVWAGPPVCKITDADGNLLYFKNNGSDPAIFDVLENGVSDGRTSAFSLLRGSSIKLYYEPESEGGTGTQYTGTTFTIKMLVETYELTNQITTVDSNGKTIILTTAGKDDKDGYPFDNDASGTRAEITRGSDVTGSMVAARTNMQFRNILLDGDSSNTTSSEDGAIVSVIGSQDTTVELQSNAVFQNGKAANGGAVAVTNGTFRINGGLIRFCDATGNGGAVYASNSNSEKGFVFAAGNIQQCSAVNGAGVYVYDGVFNMSGGSISNCAASGSGGGVYVAAGKTMNMSGGRIGTDGANTAVTSGGGIAAGVDAQLNFTKQVNISRNTCDASEATGSLCNVQLDQDSNTVIRTEGLYARSYIGVYVPGDRNDENPDYDTGNYAIHGGMGDPFGYYEGSTSNLYCFVNDRNGLKGGRTDPFTDHMIYWIKIFSIEISKEVEVSENVPDSVKNSAETQEFTFTVRLWDTNDNVSSIKVKDIAEEIAAAVAVGEDSKYGNIPFALDPNSDSLITAVITMKSGDTYAADNLPDGLGYDVTETSVSGYANIPDSLTAPINFCDGKTGENKNRTDVNPYVSTVAFKNILPVCKVTDTSGNLLYRNTVGGKVTNGTQTPAVYKDLSEAFAVINGGTLYTQNSNLSYSGAVKIEMLLPEYTLTSGQTLTTTHAVSLTTAADSTTDGFPFNPTGETLSGGLTVATIKRGIASTTDSMLALSANSDCTITDVKLDGNLVQTSADGGLVYVPSGAKLTVTNGAILQNSRTTGNGAGVYVADGGQLYLSGDPVFGTTDTDAYGYLYNGTGNFKVDTLTGKQNGGKNYTVAHQDIYLAEAHENAPASLIIAGDITGEDGSIWVWAESEYHYKTLMPFAMLADGVTFADEPTATQYDAEHLKIFRNAQDDDTAENTTGAYLYGRPKDKNDADEAEGYVYWNGIKGSASVMLVKVLQSGNSYKALANRTFTVYTDSEKTRVANGTIINDSGAQEEIPLSGLSSSTGGAFFIGELAYGTYYVAEEGVPGTFVITIDNGGVVRITDNATDPVPVKTVRLTP
jgi:uncharacterized repeat protein (TIGR02543 family)